MNKECENCKFLAEENKKLRETISTLNKAINQINAYNRREARYGADYLPYEEDYDR